MSENIRRIPAKVVGSEGRTADAVIATPAWTRAELEGMVRGEVERGLLTEEQADRMIEQGRRELRDDGTPRAHEARNAGRSSR